MRPCSLPNTILLWLVFAPNFHAQPTQSKASFEELAARARQAAEAERTDEAIGLYGRLTKLRPDWAEGWWRLGGLLFYTGHFADSRNAFQNFVSKEPKAGSGFAMIGLCEFELKRYPQALAALEEGVRLGLGPNPELARNALYRDATLLSLLGQPDIALKRLTLLANQAAAAQPNADARSLLGDLELVDAMGIAALRIASLPGDLPRDRTALVRKAGRAQTLVGLHDWVAAAQEFAELQASFGQEPGVHYMYGVFLLKEHPAAALAEFEKEVEVSPNNVDARIQMALECLRTGDYPRGQKNAADAIEIKPDNFAAHLVSGRLWLALGNVTRAIEEAQLAVKLAPDSPDAHLTLSRCYAQAKRAEDAERERAEFRRLQALAEAPVSK